MTPFAIFLISVAAVAGLDLLIWSQINFIRNVPIPDGEKIPFLYPPAVRADPFQILRWLIIGALLSACNVFLSDPSYGVIFAGTMIVCIVHLALSTMRYWKIFSAAIEKGAESARAR